MSPITAAARERLDTYLHETVPDRRTERMLRQMIDDLVAAIRAEWPEDNVF